MKTKPYKYVGHERVRQVAEAEKDEEENRFENHYECKPCGETWSDESPSMNNDECPKCGAETEPWHSEELNNEQH